MNLPIDDELIAQRAPIGIAENPRNHNMAWDGTVGMLGEEMRDDVVDVDLAQRAKLAGHHVDVKLQEVKVRGATGE